MVLTLRVSFGEDVDKGLNSDSCNGALSDLYLEVSSVFLAEALFRDRAKWDCLLACACAFLSLI